MCKSSHVLGESVWFEGKKLIIGKIDSWLKGQELYHRYYLMTKRGILMSPKGESEKELMFYGGISRIACKKENRMMQLEIYGIGQTIKLDRVRKKQSF